MKYVSIPVTPFEQNCSIVWCEETKECAFIDAGGDVQVLINEVEKLGLKPIAIFLTHGHLDHVGGSTKLAKHYDIEIIGPHEEDKFWLDALPIQSQRFGFDHADSFVPARWLKQGDTLTVGKESFKVYFTPGHTPGHVVLHNEAEKIVFVGDVLFAGSIGRTDFPRGNHQQLIDSIKRELWELADDTVVVPGHGPNTTVGHEKRTNPFIR